MIRVACLSLLLIASANGARAQASQIQNSECAGFELGLPPPPPPPSATEKDYPDFRDSHKWCKANWCRILSAMVSNNQALTEEEHGWSGFMLIRTEAFFGDAFQLAIWEFPNGRIEVKKWTLPPWSATTEMLLKFRFEHPDSPVSVVAKAVPVNIGSSVLSQTSKHTLKLIQHQLKNNVRQGMPACDDRSYWISTQHQGKPPEFIKFYAAPNQKLSVRIYNFIRSVVPNTPNPPLNSDPACIAFHSLSISRFLGSVQRLGAGGAG